jgi:hypothetical protein
LVIALPVVDVFLQGVRCLLQVVGYFLQDVGCIRGDVGCFLPERGVSGWTQMEERDVSSVPRVP